MQIVLLENGFSIDGIALEWGLDREVCRSRMGIPYKVADMELDFSDLLPDASPIKQLRDIYGSVDDGTGYYFLNYKDQEGLDSLELHQFGSIVFQNITLNYEMDINEALERLYQHSNRVRVTGTGYHEFKELHLSLASAEAMGQDDGDMRLAYFYYAGNVDHFD